MIDPIKITLGVDVAQAAESVKSFVAETKQTLEGGIVTSVEKAQKSFDQLGRKILQVQEIVQQDRQRLEQVTKAKETASQAEQKQADQEIGNLKRIIANREIEIATIQEKRTKLNETIALSTAVSDEERQAIQNATADRLVEIGVMKDQGRAQIGINETVQEGTGLLDSYFGRFVGIGGIIVALQEIRAAFQSQREEMEKIIAATEHFRDLNRGQFQNYKPFYSEFGITSGTAQDKARDALNQVASSNALDQSTVSEAATALAPTLRERGITDVSGKQFQGLVGTASLYGDKGFDPKQISNLLFESLKTSPQLSGQQFNQQLANLVAVAGSPQRASGLLETFYANREKAQAAGLGLQDIEKMYTFLRGKGEAPEQIPNDIGRAVQGLDRLLGLNPDEKIDLQEKLGQAGAGKVGALLHGKLNIPQFAQALAGLNDQQRAIVDRSFAGPRGVVAVDAIAGYQRQSLATGSPLVAPTNVVQQAEAAAQAADAAAAAAHPTSVSETTFKTDLENRIQHLQDFPQELPWYLRGGVKGLIGKLFPTADVREVAAAQLRATDLISVARQRQAATSPQEIARLDKLLSDSYSQLISSHSRGPELAQLRALTYGSANDWNGGTITRSQVLSGITDPNKTVEDENFLPTGAINFSTYKGEGTVANVHDAGAIRDRATTRPTTRPSTQPTGSPVSINYHVRQTNYGYGYDSIGAPTEQDNRFG